MDLKKRHNRNLRVVVPQMYESHQIPAVFVAHAGYQLFNSNCMLKLNSLKTSNYYFSTYSVIVPVAQAKPEVYFMEDILQWLEYNSCEMEAAKQTMIKGNHLFGLVVEVFFTKEQ